jgi:hypothetical protein
MSLQKNLLAKRPAFLRMSRIALREKRFYAQVGCGMIAQVGKRERIHRIKTKNG